MNKAEIAEFYRRLAERIPEPETELDYVNHYTLLVAVVLSAQATDASVNLATRDLFGVSQPHADERLSCLALERLDEIFAGTPALLDRNRALADAFFAGRADIDHVPQPHGITLFPRLRRGSVDALDQLLREKYDASIVPGRWFEAPDHFRLGIGGPTEIVEAGLQRLAAAMDELE